jgi:hypothetical protein
MAGVSPKVKYGAMRLCQTSGAGNVSKNRLGALRTGIVTGLVGEMILPRSFCLEVAALALALALALTTLGFLGEAARFVGDVLAFAMALEAELGFLGEAVPLVGDLLWVRSERAADAVGSGAGDLDATRFVRASAVRLRVGRPCKGRWCTGPASDSLSLCLRPAWV